MCATDSSSQLGYSQEILPVPGPTRLSKDSVKQAHRFRLLQAIATVVARSGFNKVSVADIVKEAKVSRRTFYELYSNRDECFLDLIEFGAEALLGHLQSCVNEQIPNETTLALMIRNYLNLLSSEPNFAKCILVESFGAGQKAINLRYEVTSKIAAFMLQMHNTAIDSEADLFKPTPDIELITFAISALVTKNVALGQTDVLDQLHERIMNFINRSIKN